MKSKTSCFNLTIFRKNFTHYWPLWALYLSYLVVVIPLNLYLNITNEYYGTYQASRQYMAMENTLKTGFLPFPVFLFAVVMAAAVFSYLYSARNANMIHALPVNRVELFVTNYLSGISFMLIPQLLIFVVSVLVCVATGITCMQYLLLWLFYTAGMTFFAYSLAVFMAMMTGQIFAMPVYFLIANYLYVGSMYLICSLIQLVSYGVSDYWNPGASCILSPIYYLGNNLRVKRVTETGSELITGLTVNGGYLIGIYSAAAVVLLAAACWIYGRRQLETAGDMLSFGVMKPVFRWGAALCGGFMLSIWVAELFKEYQRSDMYLWIIVCIVIFGFLCFFIAEMLLEKSFKVFRKKRVAEWAAFSVVAVVFLSLFKLDAFGIERYVPEESEIEAAFINMDYPVEVSAEEFSKMTAVHRAVIENKKVYGKMASEESGYYYTTFRYYLKDGSMTERRYPLPVTEEYRNDASSPTAVILAWESRKELLKELILGKDYEENQYYFGSVELYAEDGRSNARVLASEELEMMIAAVERDIEEGNFNDYYLSSIAPKEEKRYMNGLSLNYFNGGKLHDVWDYFHNYRRYHGQSSNEETIMSDGGSYIVLGPDCTNVIRVLEELGITDDNWKLITYEEYQEYTKT